MTTVSLALRNHPRLPEKTRHRIQKLAKEMSYRPDPVLQALVAYRGKVMERRNPPHAGLHDQLGHPIRLERNDSPSPIL